jgi:hypothetical protein
VLGDKTRSRGTPLPDAIVGQPAANFIRNHFHIRSHLPLRCFHNRSVDVVFYIDEAGEGGNPFSLRAAFLISPFPCTPSPEIADIHRPVEMTRLLKSNLQNLSG